METTHLDTHTALWFYGGQRDLLSPKVCSLIEQGEAFISPAVLLEIQFLKESGKLNIKVDRFLQDMHAELGLRIAPALFINVTLQAVKVSWTRDPFDRLIVAQAIAEDAILLTRDRTILEHYPKACWE